MPEERHSKSREYRGNVLRMKKRIVIGASRLLKSRMCAAEKLAKKGARLEQLEPMEVVQHYLKLLP